MLRDENGIAHLVGVSGGKDSTCLALALKEREPRPYTYVYTPTGDELPEMVEHWKRLEELLGPIVSVTGRTLRQTIEEQKALPSFRLRFCTRLIKLAPYGRFIAAAAPAISYIGLRADEEEADRGGATHGGDYITADEAKGVTQRFPLREWGWGIDEVWAFLNERGIEIPERTDCARCPYQKLGEWYNLWMKHPAIYADAEAQESQYGHTFRSPGRDTWPAHFCMGPQLVPPSLWVMNASELTSWPKNQEQAYALPAGGKSEKPRAAVGTVKAVNARIKRPREAKRYSRRNRPNDRER